MVVPPDSNNPPTASPAGDQHGSDLTLNGLTSAAGVVPELRLKPEVDSSSTLVPERPHVAIFFADEPDRSWLSRLLSWTAPWKKEHLQPSAHDEPVPVEAEPVPVEAIENFERPLALPAALRDVGASIDQRLAPVEAVSGQRAGATIDAAVHDLCSQTYDRLVRVEAAIQRTEGFVAEKPWELSAIAHTRLERVEEILRLTQESLADSTLRDTCVNIDARLERTEATLHRKADIAAERLQELAAQMTARFGDVDETLRLTRKSLADSMLPEVCDNIEKQLIQARAALQRTEEAVADKTLHQLCQNIDARLERTEDTLHRSESIIAESLQELAARMTARFAEVEETIQRIERMVASRTLEQTPSQQPSVRMDDRLVQAEETARPADGGILASAVLFLNGLVKIKQRKRPIQLPWMAGLAVPVLLVVAVLAIGDLIGTSRSVAPENVVPIATTDQVSTPVVPAANQENRPASTTAVMANAPRSTRERPVSAEQPSPDREAAPTATRPQRFVGTLSITSVPSGASVSINGKPAGVTPLRLTSQRAGSLAVQITHDGFERWSAAVRVPADRLTNVTARLRATPR